MLPSDPSYLFSSVVVLAEFHPRAKAVHFWHTPDDRLLSRVLYNSSPLHALEQLEADIATVTTSLAGVVLPDFYAFCTDIEAIFAGAQPSGPVASINELDWARFRRISAYAQYWQLRHPQEVKKLLSFVMGIPLFSVLLGRLVIARHSAAEQEIFQHISQSGNDYILGVGQFKGLFRDELDTAYNEAKMLVATFRGTRTDKAANLVNRMVASAISKH